MNKPNVFLDLDGVMADLEEFYLSNFGHKMDDCPNRGLMWQNIHTSGKFFADLPVMSGAQEFLRKLLNLSSYYDRLSILTSCPKSKYEEVATQKRQWVNQHLGPLFVIPCRDSETKPLFLQRAGDILIDDWGKNCQAWEAAGGIAIKHEGEDFDTTYDGVRATLGFGVAHQRRAA